MNPEDQALWTRWRDLESQGRKQEALVLAEELAAALARAPEDSQDRWVQSVCEDVIDLHPVPPGVGIPQLRHPFLREVIAPSLLRRFARQDATAARWLAWLMRRYSSAHRLWAGIPPGRRTPMDMLRLADTWAPGDLRVMVPLAELLNGRFRYAMHELPAGVLDGINGADIPGCSAMLDELAQLERLWSRLSPTPVHQSIIEYWRRLITCYADYLSQDTVPTFEAYLQRHFPDWRHGPGST